MTKKMKTFTMSRENSIHGVHDASTSPNDSSFFINKNKDPNHNLLICEIKKNVKCGNIALEWKKIIMNNNLYRSESVDYKIYIYARK